RLTLSDAGSPSAHAPRAVRTTRSPLSSARSPTSLMTGSHASSVCPTSSKQVPHSSGRRPNSSREVPHSSGGGPTSSRKVPHSSGEALSLKPTQKGGLKLKQFPKNMIAKDAIKAWKLSAMIYVLVLWLLTIGVFILSYIFEWNFWYGGAAIMISLLCTYLFIFLFPNIRWRRWRYEVFEQEVYIQHGV